MPKNLEISYLLDFYGDVLSPKQKEVMEQYYNDDLSLAEISENFGITRQGVRDAIKRAEGILLQLEEKVGIVKEVQSCNGQQTQPLPAVEQGCEKMLEILASISE